MRNEYVFKNELEVFQNSCRLRKCETTNENKKFHERDCQIVEGLHLIEDSYSLSADQMRELVRAMLTMF